jgi:hypothetical protein
LLLATDATLLSAMVNGTVLVAESGVMARRGLARAHRILEAAGEEFSAVCSINGMPAARATTPTTDRTIAAVTVAHITEPISTITAAAPRADL